MAEMPDKVGERLGVFVVPAKWILKPVSRLEDLLRPLRVAFASEDPALVVLGLDHEDAVT